MVTLIVNKIRLVRAALSDLPISSSPELSSNEDQESVSTHNAAQTTSLHQMLSNPLKIRTPQSPHHEPPDEPDAIDTPVAPVASPTSDCPDIVDPTPPPPVDKPEPLPKPDVDVTAAVELTDQGMRPQSGGEPRQTAVGMCEADDMQVMSGQRNDDAVIENRETQSEARRLATSDSRLDESGTMQQSQQSTDYRSHGKDGRVFSNSKKAKNLRNQAYRWSTAVVYSNSALYDGSHLHQHHHHHHRRNGSGYAESNGSVDSSGRGSSKPRSVNNDHDNASQSSSDGTSQWMSGDKAKSAESKGKSTSPGMPCRNILLKGQSKAGSPNRQGTQGNSDKSGKGGPGEYCEQSPTKKNKFNRSNNKGKRTALNASADPYGAPNDPSATSKVKSKRPKSKKN